MKLVNHKSKYIFSKLRGVTIKESSFQVDQRLSLSKDLTAFIVKTISFLVFRISGMTRTDIDGMEKCYTQYIVERILTMLKKEGKTEGWVKIDVFEAIYAKNDQKSPLI
jgi:hypothetical protein